MMKELFTGMLPPKIGDAEGNQRWQYTVLFKLWALLVFAVWALDIIPGTRGLARAGDMDQLQANVTAIQESLLEGQILQVRREQCKAMAEGNNSARSFYGEKLLNLRIQYYELTKRAWDIPDCNSI